jgi:hypothetical protein
MAVSSLGLTTYFPIPQQGYNQCVQIVQFALSYWNQMMIMFAAENIAMGITQSGKTLLISNALEQVVLYGSQGSLWEAYAALSKVVITPEMAPFLTENRINWMRNQMVAVIAMLP